MLNFSWAALCHTSSVDADTNNVSLFKIVEQINIPAATQFPATIPVQFQFIFSLRRSKEDLSKAQFPLRLDLIGSDDSVLSSLPMEDVSFEEGTTKMRAIVDIQGIKVSGWGIHRIVITDISNNAKLGEVPYEISSKESE